jgi:NADPH-dependent 7-cyano-7-deazaguanine reductase QueF
MEGQRLTDLQQSSEAVHCLNQTMLKQRASRHAHATDQSNKVLVFISGYHRLCIQAITIMPNTLELNCLVSGNDPDHIFTIEIANIKNVSALKDAIKNKKLTFQHVDADTLVLWKVSFPVDESLAENLMNFVGKKLLSPVNKLLKLFSNVDDTHLHIVMGCPPGACK